MIVKPDVFVPDSLKTSQDSHLLFLIGLFFLTFGKGFDKLRSDFIDFSFKQVTWLILLWEETFFSCFKIKLEEEIFLLNPVIS